MWMTGRKLKKSRPQRRIGKIRRLKMMMKVKDFILWTLEEETALCKSWVRVSEDSVVGNTSKDIGFWTVVLGYVEQNMKVTGVRTDN